MSSNFKTAGRFRDLLIIEEFEAQLLNYLKSTEIEVGYVMNFGKSASFKRKVFDNERKGTLHWMKK